MLMDNEGRRVEGKEELKLMAVEFYSNLLKTNAGRHSAFIMGQFPNTDLDQQKVWGAEVSTEDMKKDLSEMGS